MSNLLAFANLYYVEEKNIIAVALGMENIRSTFAEL